MTQPAQETLRLMPREMRMMAERIFSLSAMPRGFALTLSDLPMLSQHLGLGGFALLRDAQEAITTANPAAIRVAEEEGAALTLDLNGQPAWVGIHAVLDMAADLTADHGRAEITVTGAAHSAELALLPALAGRTGLLITHYATADGARLVAEPAPIADLVIATLNRDGVYVAADLWWEVYELARSALAPDTALSRRHAGVQIVNEDGTVIGRQDSDDDADVGFLARGARETA